MKRTEKKIWTSGKEKFNKEWDSGILSSSLNTGWLCEVQPEAERWVGCSRWNIVTWGTKAEGGLIIRNPCDWLRVMGLPGNEYFRQHWGVLLQLSGSTHNMGQDMCHHKIGLSINTHTHTMQFFFSIIQNEHISDCLFMLNSWMTKCFYQQTNSIFHWHAPLNRWSN